MEKLEHYLDQVCRGIAGPRSLRQHVRQELREHLLDAVAVHRAAGLSEDQALEKALDDFGGPEHVRGEWETLHGRRLLTTVVDKSLDWKERTMKARWLWSTSAHFSLAGVIVFELAILAWSMVFIVPAYVRDREYRLFRGPTAPVQEYLDRADTCLTAVVRLADNVVSYWFLWFALFAAAWGTFEWRVRSENKSLMRLSAMGLAALVLAATVSLSAASLMTPYVVAVQELYASAPEPIVAADADVIDAALGELQHAAAQKDWRSSQRSMSELRRAMSDLARRGAAAPVIVSLAEKPKIDQLRLRLRDANASMIGLENAIRLQDPDCVSTALNKFLAAYKAAIAQ